MVKKSHSPEQVINKLKELFLRPYYLPSRTVYHPYHEWMHLPNVILTQTI